VWRPENKTVRLHTSKKVEVGIHSSTSRLVPLCMGLVIEKAVIPKFLLANTNPCLISVALLLFTREILRMYS
jgi:hypothetical protein